MATLESVVVPKNSGRAFVVKKGQRIRIAGRFVKEGSKVISLSAASELRYSIISGG